jgi:alginate O-acetyltransferase complex protein AlgI
MAFSSPLFLLLFIPLFFIMYFAIKEKYRNFTLLVGSYLFYSWGAPKFAPILLVSILVDWYLGNKIYRQRDSKKSRKRYLILFLVFNIAMLAYFKYANFMIDNLNPLVTKLLSGTAIEWQQILIPLGLSFITFHKISYALDIYYLRDEPGGFSSYALYILMFPKVLAGPIIKFRDFSKQLTHKQVSLDNTMQGVFMFSRGLAKKVLIADTLSVVADKIFLLPINSLDSSTAWLGIIGYTFQLYFDFSGYSDMAIGLAKIMGFDFGKNFDYPYISQSFTEFWRRWHITLSEWLKEYLYIPLGGNRCSKFRNYLNLWIVFFVSGMWHGANWTFIFWGLYHGTFLVIDKVFWLKTSKRLLGIVNTAITFFLVMLGWVFFRAGSMTEATNFIYALFDFSRVADVGSQHLPPLSRLETVTFMCAALLSFVPLLTSIRDRFGEYRKWFVYENREAFYMMGSIGLLLLSISKAIGSSVASFIYFKF